MQHFLVLKSNIEFIRTLILPYLTAGVMLSLPGHFQRSTCLLPSVQNLFDWTHKRMMKVIVQWICCIWKIDISLLSPALSVYSSPPLSWWNRAAIEWFHYSHHESEKLAVAFCDHWRELCTMLWIGLVSSNCRMGIFHVAGWMHAKPHMILIFSFALVTGPQSRLCGCVWVCVGVPLNVIHFMLVFTCLERFMSVGIQD